MYLWVKWVDFQYYNTIKRHRILLTSILGKLMGIFKPHSLTFLDQPLSVALTLTSQLLAISIIAELNVSSSLPQYLVGTCRNLPVIIFQLPNQTQSRSQTDVGVPPLGQNQWRIQIETGSGFILFTIRIIVIRKLENMETNQTYVKIEHTDKFDKIQTRVEAENQVERKPLNYGEWTKNQIFKYFLFVFHNKYKFSTKSLRKSLKMFRCMTKFIKSRSSSQCRTRHQHVLSKSSSLESAIRKFIAETPDFYYVYEQARRTLEAIEENQFLEDNSKVIKYGRIPPCPSPPTYPLQESEAASSQWYPTVPIVAVEPALIQDCQLYKRQLIEQCQMLFVEWISKMSNLIHFYNM